MVRTLLRLPVGPAGQDAVVDFYLGRQVLNRALSTTGCHSAELLVDPHRTGEILVTSLWSSAEAYRRWVDSPTRAGEAADLAGLLDGDLQPAVVYSVALTTESAFTTESALTAESAVTSDTAATP